MDVDDRIELEDRWQSVTAKVREQAAELHQWQRRAEAIEKALDSSSVVFTRYDDTQTYEIEWADGAVEGADLPDALDALVERMNNG